MSITVRTEFRVTTWDSEKQTGTVKDREGCTYPVSAARSLAPECEGHIAVGDLVSGILMDFETIGDILIEKGSAPISQRKQLSERKEFESAGSTPKGTWSPRTGNPSYAPGVTPDSGRFSHPRSRESVKKDGRR
jgi:hypothetical protein